MAFDKMQNPEVKKPESGAQWRTLFFKFYFIFLISLQLLYSWFLLLFIGMPASNSPSMYIVDLFHFMFSRIPWDSTAAMDSSILQM